MNYTQISILDIIEGEALKQAGMNQAIQHANEVVESWSDKACRAAELFLSDKPSGFTFMIEDIRYWAEEKGLIEPPPSARAYCAVSAYLKKKLAIVYGIGKVKNPLAHGAMASVYIKL